MRRYDRVLVVKNIVKDWASLEALSQLCSEIEAKIWGAFAVVSISDKWRENIEKYSIKRVKILRSLSELEKKH